MNPTNDRNRRKQARLKPSVEGLETRDLMSVAPLLGNLSSAAATQNAAFVAAENRSQYLASIPSRATTVQIGPHGITPFQTAIGQALEELYPPGSPQPTPHEIVRQTLIAKFTGSYILGPPRFTNQAFQIAIKGSGGSNQSFHNSILMGSFIPRSLTKGTISGVASIMPKNIAETGSMLVLDLTGNPNYLFHGLPTHYTWTADSNSGGIYLAGAGFNIGTGTLDIHFIPNGKLRSRAFGGGKVQIVVQGIINTGGVFSDIQIPGAH